MSLDLLVRQKVELKLEIELATPVVKEILVDEWVYLDCWSSLLLGYSMRNLDATSILGYKYSNKDYFLYCNSQHFNFQHNLLRLDYLSSHYTHAHPYKIHRR